MAANVASSKMHYNASSVSNILAITSLCLILTSTFAIGASPPKSSTLQAANNQQANLTQTRTTGDTKTPSKTNSGTQQKQQVSIVDQQQESPTDISSMYVQIPIAEPNDAGIQETSGQQASSDGSPADGSAASSSGESSSWTGPWPKKFQIGYIKQSDLHQVLIDSLKNDPFVSIGTPNKPSPAKQSAGSSALATPAPGKASKTNAPVETKTLMVPRQAAPMAQWPAAPYNGQQQQIQRPNSNKNAYVFQAQQHAKLSHQPSFAQMNQRAIPHHQQAHRSQQRPAPFSNQQHNFNGQHHNQAQDQFQFANFPPNQIKNQPMYTINSFPNHMEHELHHMQHNRQLQHLQSLFGQQQAHSAKPTKSNEYYSSSWRPVTNEKPGDELGFQQQQQQQAAKSMSQADFQNLNDGFDDGFNSPSKDAVSGTSMNRHPMLNSYLGSMTNSNQGADASLGAGKMSPPMNNAARDQQVDISGQFATKSAPKTTGSTKSSAPRGTADGSTKSTREISGVKTGTKQSDDGMVLSNDKRNLNGTANSTEASLTTTVSSTLADENFANTTTMSPLSTNTGNGTTSTSAPTTTQSTGDEETTTDSDVVTVETETSNEPTESTTTASTTTASTASADGAETSTNSGQTTSSTPAADSQRSAGEKGGQENVGSQDLGETATQSPINSRPTDSSNETSTTTSTQSPRSSGSTTTSSQREETTPSAQSEARAGEVEGARMEKNAKLDSMSDEALMATAVKTSDIGKTNNLTRQRAAAGSTTKKLVRSSERLINQANQQTSGRKGGQQQANKLITKKPPSSPSSNRSGKQVSEPIGTKGTSKSLASTKSANIKNSSSSKRKSSSSNNQQQQRWKGQASGGPKITRMAQASERLTQQPQVVSMSAAQAQSTAQTLASLLLARCMSSSSCSHLLDMCTTKQAMIPLESVTSNSAEPTSTSTTLKPSSDVSTSANWSMPVGLMSNSLMSLTQALQADKVLKLFPQWKDQVENIVDQDTQTGYTLILPSNEAIERLPMATIDSWLGNQDLLAQVIDNHIIDSAETIEIVSSDASRTPTRMLRNKGLQINQHKNKLVTINGKRLVYANQAAPCKYRKRNRKFESNLNANGLKGLSEAADGSIGAH